MSGFWGKATAIVVKDVLAELRRKDVAASMLVFALLLLVVFNFAFDITAENEDLLGAGVIWATFTFAGVLGFTRSFVLEKEKDCLSGLMLCPVDRASIYAGKMIASLAFMLLVEAIALPLFAVLFDLDVFQLGMLPVVLLATVGFAAVGTLFSAVAVNSRARDIMLPLLFLPVVVPVIIAAVKSTQHILAGDPWSELWSWLEIMAAFDAVFMVISSYMFEFVTEQ